MPSDQGYEIKEPSKPNTVREPALLRQFSNHFSCSLDLIQMPDYVSKQQKKRKLLLKRECMKPSWTAIKRHLNSCSFYCGLEQNIKQITSYFTNYTISTSRKKNNESKDR